MPASFRPDTTAVRCEQTLFGASWDGPSPAVQVLRANAAAAGAALAPVTDQQAAAAVLGAHMWCAATGRTSLVDCSGLNSALVGASVNVLARAAGSPTFLCAAIVRPVPPRALADRLSGAADEAETMMCRWQDRWGISLPAAAAAAAGDLWWGQWRPGQRIAGDQGGLAAATQLLVEISTRE